MWWKQRKQCFRYRQEVHAHLLPDLDDGVKTLEEAIEIVGKLKSLGIERFSLTPHVAFPHIPNNRKTIGEALKLLQEACPGLVAEAGAEYRVTEEVVKLGEQSEILPFHKHYVLIENSFLGESVHLKPLIFLLRSKGFIPVLAHPERYLYYKDDFIEKCLEFRRLGCLLQLNLLSLAGYYGWEAEKLAWKLLKTGLVSFIGSDCHNREYANALEEFLYSRPAGKLNEYTFLNK